MSALSDAIARSFATGEPERQAVSPLRALGRRQLSGFEVLAQSVATTAPAVSMVVLPVTMFTHQMLLSGLITIVVATVVVSLIAVCVSQFTRRMAAAGGLYSFVFQGLGTRAALTAGVAMLTKYVGSAVMTLYHGGQAVITTLSFLGLEMRGPADRVLIYAGIALVILGCLVRGVRFAALAILAIETCSLLFIVGLMVVTGAGGQHAVVPPEGSSSHGLLTMALVAVFALAGFESATFFGPEAKRPLATVTRTVLLTPMICGALFIFAGWAAWSGRADTLVNAYLHGTSTGVAPAVVIALNIGLGTSWLASAMASSNAASRLVYSMGVESVVPRLFARVQRGYRTPYAALALIVCTVCVGAATFGIVGKSTAFGHVQLAARTAVIAAYVLVAVASVQFLRRIQEYTALTLCAGVAGSAAGGTVLTYLLFTTASHGLVMVPAVMLTLLLSGSAWHLFLQWHHPASLMSIGVFDSAETEDVLPGAGVFATDATGNLALTASARTHEMR
ncbi:APC family permease [Rhodococcus sp. WAY2]|uniref:APC family permease n=1 Tax=Rhodococcus sp. WAY2 TaxID=2663121 RepID=UPI00131F691B|nr:APC family permease [Rhodococcus sp. WAY2]QHE68201.1 putative amino acid permease [Rhodococcus sp. WAY2]